MPYGFHRDGFHRDGVSFWVFERNWDDTSRANGHTMFDVATALIEFAKARSEHERRVYIPVSVQNRGGGSGMLSIGSDFFAANRTRPGATVAFEMIRTCQQISPGTFARRFIDQVMDIAEEDNKRVRQRHQRVYALRKKIAFRACIRNCRPRLPKEMEQCILEFIILP